MKHTFRPALLLALALAGSAVYAQDAQLQLFEPFEQTGESAPTSSTTPTNTANRPGAAPFALVGTSRFGDRHQALLRHSSGQTVRVSLPVDASEAPIPGYPGFTIEQLADKQLQVRHPAGTPCVPDTEQGISCLGGERSQLSLATAKPIQPPAAPAAAEPARTEPASEGSAPQDNPFAAALRAARERGEIDEAVTRAEAQRFRPRRIDPADVPPGARVVRTPFGDRIVNAE